MAKTMGVILSARILCGIVLDHTLQGTPLAYLIDKDDEGALVELHTDLLIETICRG